MIIFLVLSNLFLHAFNCEDTDKGQVINVPGVTISSVKICDANPCVVSQIIERDVCIDNNKVLEYYCIDDESKSKAIDCPKSSSCKLGSCQ